MFQENKLPPYSFPHFIFMSIVEGYSSNPSHRLMWTVWGSRKMNLFPILFPLFFLLSLRTGVAAVREAYQYFAPCRSVICAEDANWLIFHFLSGKLTAITIVSKQSQHFIVGLLNCYQMLECSHMDILMCWGGSGTKSGTVVINSSVKVRAKHLQRAFLEARDLSLIKVPEEMYKG